MVVPCDLFVVYVSRIVLGCRLGERPHGVAADTLCVCPMATWLWVCRFVIIIMAPSLKGITFLLHLTGRAGIPEGSPARPVKFRFDV